MTYRQLCSDITGELRSNNIDERIPNRLIVSRFRDKVKNFVKQDADNRRIFKMLEMWTTFPCFELKEVPAIECSIGVKYLTTIMKSKEKLPKVFSTNYGNLVRVFTINGEKEYKLITAAEYTDICNREFRDRRIKYAWIENRYLFIPDSSTEKVKLIALADLDEEEGGDCAKPLDSIISIPDYLIDIAKKDLVNEFLRSPRSVVVDEKPNQNSNVKV